ncbi:phospholipase A2 inhibitor and Ly6/PLAUR domain-containing protein-like [Zootoca vivipara]|uniref:phospholipase A2 inhibitor and Ly6/PLAUR domain-containing protein-like n=1 Tax=Zootoca vivipara TaxID=8524 RepID=UPI00158FEE54|nr:phospholipase A2 inhibitor and Ly6/PLAUR domain-containing protein-like [Zootoca vivipara]
MKLFLLYLFAALIAAANSLECVCTPGTKECQNNACTVDGGSCISAEWNFTISKARLISEFRGCEGNKARFDACKAGDLVFTAGTNFTWNSVCCKTKNCNNVRPAVNTTVTRKVCPTCFVFSDKPCHGKKENCTGSQDYCLTISGDFQDYTHPSTAFFGQGCATHAAKILVKGTKMTFGEVDISIATSHIEKAKDGASLVSGSIAFTILLPYLLGLLLDKFLY